MKTFQLSYATPSYYEAQANSAKCANKNNFNTIVIYRPEDVDKFFLAQHKEIMSQELGAGNCLWKPWIILDCMYQYMQDGDFLLYMDASDNFNETFKDTILGNLNYHGQFFIGTAHKNRIFTRRKCFQIMGLDTEKYWDSCQIEAGCVGLIKNDYNFALVSEWLTYCCIPDAMIRKNEKDEETLPGFQRHNCDQSILSLLITKYGLEVKDNSFASVINYNAFDP